MPDFFLSLIPALFFSFSFFFTGLLIHEELVDVSSVAAVWLMRSFQPKKLIKNSQNKNEGLFILQVFLNLNGNLWLTIFWCYYVRAWACISNVLRDNKSQHIMLFLIWWPATLKKFALFYNKWNCLKILYSKL